jgi:hypothetical protein
MCAHDIERVLRRYMQRRDVTACMRCRFLGACCTIAVDSRLPPRHHRRRRRRRWCIEVVVVHADVIDEMRTMLPPPAFESARCGMKECRGECARDRLWTAAVRGREALCIHPPLHTPPLSVACRCAHLARYPNWSREGTEVYRMSISLLWHRCRHCRRRAHCMCTRTPIEGGCVHVHMCTDIVDRRVQRIERVQMYRTRRLRQCGTATAGCQCGET